MINAVEGAMNAVAELVIGLMLSLAREIPRADREVRNGNWIKKELMGSELRGKYLGIIGLGNIGKRLGRLARALNMNIIGFDVVPIDEEFTKENGGKIITNGEKNLKDLYKYFDLDAPASEASTISGHILEIAKRIPLFGETVNDDYFIYKILSHSRKQISKIEISLKK